MKKAGSYFLVFAAVSLIIFPRGYAEAWTLFGDQSVEGYLGVGTEDPNYDFHIHNTRNSAWMQFTTRATGTGYMDGFFLGIEGDNTAQLWSETGMPIIMVPGGSDFTSRRTYFNTDGKVGIGTANPTSKLTVNGMIETLSGGIKFPDGTVQTTAMDTPGFPAYEGVAVVAKSGGDYTDPVDAMNDLAAWCGAPSATNPCLLKIMPGVYDITPGGSLVMREYVDIEGSGENVTKISRSRVQLDPQRVYTLIGANNSELRFLTVEVNNALNNYQNHGFVIYNSNASLKITNVTLTATGGYLCYGIYNNMSSPTMNNVTIAASGCTVTYGIYNYQANPSINNAKISGSGNYSNVGIINYSYSSPSIINVTITASGGGAPIVVFTTIRLPLS